MLPICQRAFPLERPFRSPQLQPGLLKLEPIDVRDALACSASAEYDIQVMHTRRAGGTCIPMPSRAGHLGQLLSSHPERTSFG